MLLTVFMILATLGAASVIPSDSVFEGRVHEDAPIGTEVTLHPEFEQSLKQYRGCLLRVLRMDNDGIEEKPKRSLAKDEPQTPRTVDSHYFQYETSKLTLITVRNMDRGVGEFYEVPMAAMCAGDTESVQWMVIVRVSQMNRMAPLFERKQYTFHASKKSPAAAQLGTVRAQDTDVVIYNSLVWYKLVSDDGGEAALAGGGPSVRTFYDLDKKTGVLRLARPLAEVPAASLAFRVEACDYGSPRKCDVANVKVEPVTVESPTNITIITTSLKYQILCWSKPRMLLDPDYYTVYIEIVPSHGADDGRIDRDTLIRHVKPPKDDGSNSSRLCAVIDFKSDRRISHSVSNGYYKIRVATHVVEDEAASPAVTAVPERRTLTCTGECSNGGTPACQIPPMATDGDAQHREDSPSGAQAEQFYHGGRAYCVCPIRYEGNQCENERFCDTVNFQSAYGQINWEKTPVDSVAYAKCPYGPDTLRVSRRCSWNSTRDAAAWGSVTGLDQCRTVDQYLTATSISGFNVKLTPTKAKQVLNTLAMLDQSGDAIVKDKRLADRMIDFINATIALDLRRLPERREMGSRIKSILTSYADKLPLSSGETAVLRSDNVVAAIMRVKSGVEVPVNIGKEATLKIPRCVVDQATVRVAEPRVSAIWLRDDKIFSFVDQPKSLYEPGHRAVLLIKIEGLSDEEPLLEPITFSLMSPSGPATFRRSTNGATCVYWLEDESKWSNDGVRTVSVDPSHGSVNCETSHLTGFSILLDFEPGRKVDSEHRRTLNLLSWIGCACSIVTLFFTIITYSLFPCLRRDHAGKVLLNLCTSMLLLNIVFILSSLRPVLNYPEGTCICIGAFLHYFTLSTLLWMGVEAANMYQMLVQVFATTERLFMVKRCAVAWGVPLVTVLATLLAKMDHYFDRDDDYCRLSSRYPAIQYGVYLAPACIILLINCIGFAFVLKVLTQTNASTSIAKPKTQTTVGSLVKYSTLVAQVRGALSVMVLLGITWVLGAFAVGPVRLPFMYAFCALNSLQGFIIFLVRCLCYDEARRAWCMFLRTGKLKQQRGKSAVENRLSDSRSSSANQRIRRANTTASTDAGGGTGGSARQLSTFRNGSTTNGGDRAAAKRMISGGGTEVDSRADPDTEVSLVPRCWKYIDDPSSSAGAVL